MGGLERRPSKPDEMIADLESIEISVIRLVGITQDAFVARGAASLGPLRIIFASIFIPRPGSRAFA